MPAMVMLHDVDPKDVLNLKIGDISDFEIPYNQVLCAVYIRPKTTKSGIHLSDNTVDEDKYQSKVGLVLAKGPASFTDDQNWSFGGFSPEINDWIVFRPSDGWNITVNGVLCRLLTDTSIRGRVQHPDQVW